ncbi:hypothetical protein [Corynebacterium urogenitale]
MKLVFRSFIAITLLSEVALLVLANSKPELSKLWLLAPITLLIVALLMLFGGMWGDYRHHGCSWATSLTVTSKRFGVPRKALALLVSEVGSLASVLSLFRPTKNSSYGGQAYTVHRNLRTVIFVLLGLSVVELIIVHLAISSSFWRYLILAVSIYAIALLCGFYASVRSRPHLLTPRGIVIRSGKRLTCKIPWSHMRDIKYVGAGQGGDIAVDENGHLRIPVLSEVNVRIEVDPQVRVEDLHKGCVNVSSIDFYCDEKESFLKGVTQQRSLVE